jgi:hypothetical protein
MQERVSQPLQSRLGEIGPVFEAGTIIFSDAAAMGIIRIVSVSNFPDQTEARVDSPLRKTYVTSLLTWERKRPLQGSSGVRGHLDLSSTEQV